ncbi:MAG: hypothetical protein LBT53_04890 [Puniceicoccales bacterium]|nr:hypothetical protein [Puniceicoccales bacterium]
MTFPLCFRTLPAVTFRLHTATATANRNIQHRTTVHTVHLVHQVHSVHLVHQVHHVHQVHSVHRHHRHPLTFHVHAHAKLP